MELELWDRDPLLRQTCAKKVLENIVGFDLNPLAVIAARTNYLLAFGDLIRYARPVEIPVYNCDAILTPVLQKRAAKGQQRYSMRIRISSTCPPWLVSSASRWR